MAKYQFFCLPGSNRKKFTYLNMEDLQFIEQKKQLLDAGFEIEDDVIFAENSAEAVEHFKSNFIYVMEEYNNSNVITALVNLIMTGYKSIFNKK
ncbi:hypothetical protein VXS05_01210 [Photobacterium toruni]|uniref:Uncharacterized protein n=1 Tax=Photobacterium toruni TaxID=1935446 RepID=A0A1T4V086_9GAMM|nr:hypothetical protein [Photobacterium toruni]MEC6813700.1 hypothetical protein [Photobacterium toruni]MEC6830472.1 hypothetical protein [Photobacterium toruni]SKA58297.1 hypothetical protein CZ814_03951 [Photobacterium toruni]